MTEPFSRVAIINGALPAVIVNASSTGSFSGIVPLTPNAVNTITLTATDRANNIGTGSIIVTEDSTPNALLISTPSQHIRATNIFLSGSTKAYASISITGGSVTSSGAADASGNFSLSVGLNQNTANTLVVTSTDPVGFVATGSIVITEDSINPTVTLLTPSQTTNDLILPIVGTTEPNSTILITGGSGSFVGLSDGSGQFSVNTSLTPAIQNTLIVTATDEAGNTGSGSVDIIHDPVVIFLDLSVVDQATNQDIFTFTGTTKSGATLTITGGSNAVTTLADDTGSFTATISLNANTANTILVTAHDATSRTATGAFTITHDAITPTITLDPIPSITADTSIDFSGMTEPRAQLTFINGTGTYQATADLSGIFSISIPLISNRINTITGTATDLANNTGTGVTFDITQDNLGPIISGLSVTPVVAGNLMNASYVFTTNEIAQSTFYVGTGANVDASLIATGATNGTSHNSIIV